LEYASLNRFHESLEALKQAASFAESADIMAALGLAYQKLGNVRLARRFYRKALNKQPGHFTASENLKRLGLPIS
jgi:Tfp pilus assembly protein PilF